MKHGYDKAVETQLKLNCLRYWCAL